MSKLLKVTLLLAFAVGLFGAYRYGAAREAGPSQVRASIHFPTFDVQVSPEATLATKHVLEGTYNNSGLFEGTGGEFVAANTFTAIDTSLTVVCPGTSGTCTIQADMWIVNGAVSSSDNQNSICLYVDGNPANNFCGAYADETPSDNSFVQSSTSQAVTGLAHGNHTVQTYFWSQRGAYVVYYNSNYRVYKP